MAKLPKVRLQQVLEKAHPSLDSLFTASMDVCTLCRLLFLVTRTKPNTKAASLRAKSYKELGAKFQKAAERVAMSMGQDRFDRMVQDIVTSPTARIQELAEVTHDGFKEEWLLEALSKKRARAGQLVSVPCQDTLMELGGMMQWQARLAIGDGRGKRPQALPAMEQQTRSISPSLCTSLLGAIV